MAVKRIEEGSVGDFWYFYNHQVEKVVEELWESGETTLPKLKILAIWMLTLEWLEQHSKANGQDGNDDIHLPKGLDTPQARRAFAKAIEKQYMAAAGDGKYRWIGTDNKGKTAELAYFLGRVYNYKHTITGNAGEDFPEESLNKLFGVTRLYSSLTQVYNAQKPQRWRSLIDDIFVQG